MRCPFMGDARLWEGHAYEMAVYGRDARLWAIHAYEMAVNGRDARLWEIAVYGGCTPMRYPSMGDTRPINQFSPNGLVPRL
jgi:hypothetical protein